MIPLKHRSLPKAEITRVVEDGFEVRSRYFKLFFLTDVGSVARFAVVMPHLQFRTAVLRNKMRRRLYDALTSVYKAWTNGVQVVILLRKGCADLDSTRLTDELSSVLMRGNLL